MSSSMEIPIARRKDLSRLFAKHKHMRGGADAVLQGHGGQAVVNSDGTPCVARLIVGPCVFFAGDPKHPAAQEMIAGLFGEKQILVDSPEWRDAVMSFHESFIRAETWPEFSSDGLDPAHLRQLSSQVPEGFRIERLDPALAERLGKEVSPHLIMPEVFRSIGDFLERGFGFCAVLKDKFVCSATSAIVPDRATEIQINTNKTHRRRGLATAVGASLLLHCLERGIDPAWTICNPASASLARKLGYVDAGTCEVLILERKPDLDGQNASKNHGL